MSNHFSAGFPRTLCGPIGRPVINDKDVVELLPDSTHNVDRKSTRLNSSHPSISYAVFCCKKKIHADQWVRSCRDLAHDEAWSDLLHRFLRTYFFFKDAATTEIYTLSLHDALPI